MDFLVPVSMTLLAGAAGIADYPGVVSSQIPRAVTVEKLALAGDDHSMAGDHCHCPVQADYPANGYGWTNRRFGYLNGRPPGPGTGQSGWWMMHGWQSSQKMHCSAPAIPGEVQSSYSGCWS